ncbi:MAG: flagellar hook-associated protein 3 [Nitrospiraceae bacterium]|nr:MAG: flagellar hook-associated protein 3 [Nitrospiraceae bacterium]
MRITSFTIFNQLTRSLSDNLRSMSRLSNMLASGKKINNPSDDVPGMMKVMDYKVSINEIEQYRRNIDEANQHLSYAETTMSSVTNALTRAGELANQASTGSQNADTRAAIAEEVANLRDEIMSLANSKFRNKYIFSGFRTDTESFDTGFNYQGDSGEVNVLIDRGAVMAINIPGDEVFGSGATSIMSGLDSLYNALINTDDAVAQAGAQTAITTISDAVDQIANVRADIGARLNRLDDRMRNMDDRNITLKTYLSEIEDTDIAGTISEISKTEVALQSLRQSGAQVLSQSLLDFLR